MRLIVAAFAFLLAGVASADTQGRVQGDPNVACGFKPHELCFQTPQDGVARAEYYSEPFYAVILKTSAPCSVNEPERVQAQALFPRRKVFALRFFCGEDVEENVRYTNVNEKYAFFAVYAGQTDKEAAGVLRDVKATRKFPGANVRKMQAVLVYP